MKNKWRAGLCLVIVLFALILPGHLTNYHLLVLNNTIIYFIAALGITMLLGMCGQMSFSAVAFMGLAGFLAAQFSKTYQIPTLAAAILAVIISSAAANLTGRALMRLTGSYFTFATIGLVSIFSTLFLNWKWLCSTADGISGVPKLDLLIFTVSTKKQWFYVLAAVALACGLVVGRIRKTYLGRAAASVRDNEIVACTLGVDVYKTKVTCFTLAGMFASISGVMLVFHNSYAVESMFTYDMSVTFILMVMLGGVNSTLGTLLGSFLMTLLPEFLRSFQQYLRLFYGIGIILLMIFMPMGLAGLFKSLAGKWKKKIKKEGNDRGREKAGGSGA